MKPINPEKILFPLNVLLTGFVFFLITPTTRIYARWFPDKEDSLWMVPAFVIGISAALWFATSLATPWLIRKGIFEDRRKAQRDRPVDVARVAGVVVNFVFHMALLLFMCILIVGEMKSGRSADFLFSRNTVWRAP